MITAIIAFIAQIPGLLGVAQKWAESRYNAQVAIVTARVGGNRDVAVKIVEAQVQAEHDRGAAFAVIAGNKILTILVVVFAAPLAFYLFKDVGFDVVIGSLHGCSKGTMDALRPLLDHDAFMEKVRACAIYSTDPIRGQAADWGNTIIWAIFGSTAAAGGIAAAVNLMKKT